MFYALLNFKKSATLFKLSAPGSMYHQWHYLYKYTLCLSETLQGPQVRSFTNTTLYAISQLYFILFSRQHVIYNPKLRCTAPLHLKLNSSCRKSPTGWTYQQLNTLHVTLQKWRTLSTCQNKLPRHHLPNSHQYFRLSTMALLILFIL